jgi:glycosyltransferase involved in cell wall biosynthesis
MKKASLTLSNWLVLIPAYNEQETIKVLIQNVLAQKPKQLIVINDASTDHTGDILQAMQQHYSFKVMTTDVNKGKAYCLWLGFDYAMENSMDAAITMDGDGQHRAEDINLLLQNHSVYPKKLVIGTRQRNLRSQPIGRFLANRFANFWISWAAGYGVQDSQSGFRLYPIELLKKVTALKTSEGFVFESEVIIEAAWQGYYVSQVNIPTLYHKNRRASHFKPWQDIKKITKMVARRLQITGFNVKDLWAAMTCKVPTKKILTK